MAINKDTARQKFKAVLEKADDGMDTAYVSIPFDVEKLYGAKGHVKVKAWFDGHPYRGILANMGTGGHIIGVKKEIRSAIQKKVGDTVSVELELDMEERILELPIVLKSAFARNPNAKKFFDTLSYTNRKEYAVWISSAKKEETQKKRLEETISKLLKGLKNPSQR